MTGPLRDVEGRFWAKVDRTGECWLWMATNNPKGYGQVRVDGRLHLAHRFAYEMEFGPIPGGNHIDHMCHIPACVNPAHLRPVTNAENHQNMQGANSNSASGVRGVTWREDRNKWRAEATLDGKKHHIGYFATVEEAEAVVTKWRRTNMPYSLMDQKKAS